MQGFPGRFLYKQRSAIIVKQQSELEKWSISRCEWSQRKHQITNTRIIMNNGWKGLYFPLYFYWGTKWIIHFVPTHWNFVIVWYPLRQILQHEDNLLRISMAIDFLWYLQWRIYIVPFLCLTDSCKTFFLFIVQICKVIKVNGS